MLLLFDRVCLLGDVDDGDGVCEGCEGWVCNAMEALL